MNPVSSSDDAERAEQRARFLAYQRTRDPALRDELFADHLRLALHLARKFDNRGVALDDLEQVASYGLLQAIDRYDPERGPEFSTFASPTIVGELKRHFRDKGWAVRVPRRVQELNLRLNGLVETLSQELGRSPTIAELAAEARASEEEVLEAIEAANAYRSHPLDEHPTDGVADPSGGHDLGVFHAENRVWVEAMIARLSPREQLLVRLRFFEEMTQQEIAERLGISQMHVSRLLGKCLDELRRQARASSR